jgi:hypothetical protein
MTDPTRAKRASLRRCYADGTPVPQFGDPILDHEIEEYRTWVEATCTDGGD